MKVRLCFFMMAFVFKLTIFGAVPAGTLVQTRFGYIPIEKLELGDEVVCCDVYKRNDIKKVISKKSEVLSNWLYLLTSKNKIATSCNQKFYIADKNEWKEAQYIVPGEVLFSSSDQSIIVQGIIKSEKPISFFDITVRSEHNFFISEDNILVHNFFPAIPAITVGFSWIFGLGSIEFAGVSIGSAIFGGLLGVLLHKNKDSSAQAPGKPTKDDGYIPPKKGDGKKVRNPNGPGYGWPDKKGDVWVPTGPNGHGGAHWDVENPDGSYINVVPGGRIRGSK